MDCKGLSAVVQECLALSIFWSALWHLRNDGCDSHNLDSSANEHHRKYFPSSLKGSLAEQSLWLHQVMGSSNINTLCILLSPKTERAFGKTSLALNVLRSVLYLGLFWRINSQLFLHGKEWTPVRQDCVNWEFHPTSIKMSCKCTFCTAPGLQKQREQLCGSRILSPSPRSATLEKPTTTHMDISTCIT